jgi:hypothetical protein
MDGAVKEATDFGGDSSQNLPLLREVSMRD